MTRTLDLPIRDAWKASARRAVDHLGRGATAPNGTKGHNLDHTHQRPGHHPGMLTSPNAMLPLHEAMPGRITPHWPEMLRIAGSLITGTVAAYDLIRALGRDGNPTPLGQAFAEYGRIAKTLHLLAVADPDDDTYQRSLNAQLNVTESRHRLARKLCFGWRGELRQAYQEGMEDQLGALGLVLNAVVLWNSTYLNAAVEQLRAQGYPVSDADAARLSPLIDTHLNVHGAYTFFLPQLTGLRLLRDPATATGGPT